MAEKKKDDKSEGDKPKIDFSKIAAKFKDRDARHNITQITPAINKVYLDHVAYKDENGVEFYKEELNVEEAEKLGDKLFDALGYHLHRRYMKGINQGTYDNLKTIKDADGNSYMDTFIEYHMKTDRKTLIGQLKGVAEVGEKITGRTIESLLEKPIENHTNILTNKIFQEIQPEHKDELMKYITELGKKYNVDPKLIKRAEKATDINGLVNVYASIVQNYYHGEDKKK